MAAVKPAGGGVAMSMRQYGAAKRPQRNVAAVGVELDRRSALDLELWKRRQLRLDQAQAAAFPPEDAELIPLVLSLARLAAQRDAKLVAEGPNRTMAA